MESEQREMPKYKCHKEVNALKIKSLRATANPNEETDGSLFMTPTEEGYSDVRLDREFVLKHKPQVGGYYVVYKDGYTSFSPCEAFEEGYTRI